MTAQARAALAAAYAAQPLEYRSFFGVAAFENQCTTTFEWRNYFTGAGGAIARAQPHEVVDVTLGLLAELRTLREGEARSQKREVRKREVRRAKRPPNAAIAMRRRKSA